MGQINAENLTQDEVRAILDEIKADYQRQKELEEMEHEDLEFEEWELEDLEFDDPEFDDLELEEFEPEIEDNRIELKDGRRKGYYTLDERIELAIQKKNRGSI